MTEQHKELLERLRAFDKGSEDFPGSYVRTVTLRNPDGPEAATLIKQQAARIEKLEAALHFYARASNWQSCTVYMCGHGAINCNVMADKGNKARSALASDGEER